MSSESSIEVIREPTLDDDFEEPKKETIGKGKPSYRMRPPITEVFQSNKIRVIINEIMSGKLKGKLYSKAEASVLIREIADEVNTQVKEQLEMPKFKHIVQVTLGQQMGSGCRYAAKCCWDAECDSYVSELFTSPSLFCVCTVFGIYQY